MIVLIELKDVSFSYNNDLIALKDINLNITSGEAVALIGANGSGKSTLLKLINGLIFPCSGNYYFKETDITEKLFRNNSFSKKFHKDIGFIFQNSEVQLFTSNVYDEIAFGLQQMRMDELEINQRVEDVLRLLQISHLKDRQPYHLSGGEKRKVAIASVLVMNPEVLVFDEPMNGLDPRTKRFLRELMISLNKAGKTIICSTHDFNYVEGVFNRAVVFSDDHTIVRDGDYGEIMEDHEFLMENNII